MSQVFVVSRGESGRTLTAVVKVKLGISWSQAQRLVESRRVRLQGRTCGELTRRVHFGQRIEITDGATKRKSPDRPQQTHRTAKRQHKHKPSPGPMPVLRHIDDAILVVDKPAGITTHRSAADRAEFGERGQRYLPSTLTDRARAFVGGGEIRAVHRIDRDTSGLVVFARTAAAETELGRQFRSHKVGRRYLAITRGVPSEGRIESILVRDRGDGRRGSGVGEGSQRAVTHVRIVERLGACCLVECRLETGRTHQVRIHLGEAGAPLAGERVYDRPVNGPPAPDPSGSPRVALHATYLGFMHPVSGEWIEWTSPLPADLEAVRCRLRSGQGRVDGQ